MEINETYKLTINGYDMNGYGVAKLDNRVIFVEKAMDGEVVIAKITNVHKKYAFAVMIKLLSPSKNRIEPLCPYSQLCGGCDLLHIDYETEKKIKENKVKQALKRREDIAEGALSLPVHASIDGVVTEINEREIVIRSTK